MSDLDAAVADLPAKFRGAAPPGLPYSPWQLLEHIRLTQADILAFCERPRRTGAPGTRASRRTAVIAPRWNA